MPRPLTVLKSVGPRLVPFLKTVVIFFVLFAEDSKLASIFYCIIKCLPVISLIIFVLTYGMSLNEYYSYSRKILFGLIFSCLGDAFLVWKKSGYFLHGIAMFAIAQLLYSWAFGFRPLCPGIGAICGVGSAIVCHFLMPGLQGIMVYMVPLYVCLIFLMAWRSIARVEFFNDLWTWTKLCSCGGAVLFMISDFVIATDKFVVEVPYSHQIIMFTYYAAQLGIALSIVDSQVDAVIDKTRAEREREVELVKQQEREIVMVRAN